MQKVDYARLIVAEGQRLGITRRGQIIALATGLVETNIKNYANSKVPASLKIPHDAVGSDGYSVGIFQQQVRTGAGGKWWWADAATCMDPTLSARMFFQALAKLDYNSDAHTPGWYAQTVQRSAFPDRYDERMPEATALYDALGEQVKEPVVMVQEFDRSDEGNSSSRNGAKVRLFVLHTEEGNSDAWRLHEWMKRNQVSYHYILAAGVCVDHVNTDRSSWSVLDANPYCINLVFAGSKASFTRQQWLDGYALEIDYAAMLFVQDAKKYDPLVPVVIGKDYRAIGGGAAGGIDHSGITHGIGIGSHTDCGPNFPFDVFAESVRKYANEQQVPTVVTPPPNEIDVMAASAPWLGDRTMVGEITPPDGRGRIVHYASGSIYWTPTTGARPIPTRLFEVYAELGFEHTLGYPVAYHTILPDGDVQAFENGVLYRKYGQPGFWVHGAIGERWQRSGYETGIFGWPTSNEERLSDGSIVQRFENGQIVWSPDNTVALIPLDGPDKIVPDRTH